MSQKAMVELELYHTCKAQGEEASIVNLAPFRAESHKPQWLGVGYYFWVESLAQAEVWGKQSPAYRPYGYLVLKYWLSLEREDLLDLVGSPKDQQGFSELLQYVAKQLGKHGTDLSVSACIAWLQQHQRFEWLAVKLADYGKGDTLASRATRVPDQGSEVTFLQPRIQLCLYPDLASGHDRIQLRCEGVVSRGAGHSRRKRPSFGSYK